MKFRLLLAIALLSQGIDTKASEPTDEMKAPETRMLVKLNGFAAQCSIDNRLALISAREKRSEAALDEAHKAAVACVNGNLPKGKAEYRDAIAKAPMSKPVLAKAYAAWLRYMDELSMLFDDEAIDRAAQAFEAASAEVQAELDAR